MTLQPSKRRWWGVVAGVALVEGEAEARGRAGLGGALFTPVRIAGSCSATRQSGVVTVACTPAINPSCAGRVAKPSPARIGCTLTFAMPTTTTHTTATSSSTTTTISRHSSPSFCNDGALQAAVEVVMGGAGGEEEDSLPARSPRPVQERGERERPAPRSTRTPRKNRARRGTANYTCPFCAKLFLDKSKWSRHLCAHTGEKPFVCSICARRFSRKDNLQTHMKDKHRIFKVQF